MESPDRLKTLTELEEKAKTAPLRPTILVVDDDPGIRQALEFVLKDNYHVELCASGEAAMAAMAAVGSQVQAIILDIKMPGMDGVVVYEKVKEQYPALPIIFRSAYRDLRQLAERSGAEDVWSGQLFISTDDPQGLQSQVKAMMTQLEAKVGSLEQEVSERTRQLDALRAQIVQAEANDKQITGGFAHELRNALQGARMPVYKALAIDEGEAAVSLCEENGNKLKELYLTVRNYVPEEVLPGVVQLIRDMNSNEKELAEALGLVKSSLDRATGLSGLFTRPAPGGRQRPRGDGRLGARHGQRGGSAFCCLGAGVPYIH